MTKKILAAALAGLMIISSASALACDKDSFVGYDIADAQGRYAKLEYCPLIGKTVIDGYASTVEWVHAFYEAEYPHKEVQTLILDGKKTDLTRYSGNFANAAVELRADFWEAKAPYNVYHRLYSNLQNAGFKPTTVVGYAGKQADVKVSWPVVGFDKYAVVDGKVYDYGKVYAALGSQVANGVVGTLAELVNAYEAQINANPEAFLAGELDSAYAIFENAIPQTTWEVIEGPDYATGKTQTIIPALKLGKQIDEMSKSSDPALKLNYHPEYYDNLLVNKAIQTVDVEWVYGGYEAEYPYRTYEYLKVNDVVLDGRYIGTPGAGQTKVGETVKKTYDIDVLDGVDNVYTYATDINPVTARQESSEVPAPHYDYENVTTTYDDLTNHLTYDKNVIADEAFVPADDINGHDDSVIVKGYEDKIVLTANIYADKENQLPRVYRYTGGVAHPVVEWKVAWPEAEYPYTIYEEKYLDGKATGIYRSTETSAEAIPSVIVPEGDPANGIRVLKVTLTGDNIQDSCLHASLITKGYEFIVNGEEVAYYRIPKVLYNGHAFEGSNSYYFGDNNEYVTEAVVAGWDEAQKALLK